MQLSEMKDAKRIFANEGMVLIHGFLEPELLKVLQYYLQLKFFIRKDYHVEYPEEGGVVLPWNRADYGDSVGESVLLSKLENVEFITDQKLYPTYSHCRLYNEGQYLKKHLDRPSCEVSLTVCTMKNVSWPIFMDEAKQLECELEEGDAVLYYGQQKVHWRNPMPKGGQQIQLLLHYVNQANPNSEVLKWDGRDGIGYARDGRRIMTSDPERFKAYHELHETFPLEQRKLQDVRDLQFTK
jgi:hypothetical protein